MDHRKALGVGDHLSFPGMSCVIEKEIGRGSNSIVYQGFYADELNRDERHTVLIKELFPLDENGAIYRDAAGNIVQEGNGAEVIWKLHMSSFSRGNQAHLRLKEEHPDMMGENYNTFICHNTLYTVLGYTGGRSLSQELAVAPMNLRIITERMLKLLTALDAFHQSDCLHLDIAPDNILLIGTGENERVMLIDYNSVYRLSNDGKESETEFSCKEGYTAPEVKQKYLDEIGPTADLYSVTAVFYRCFSGKTLDPLYRIFGAVPDISEADTLRGKPEIVCDMVSQILCSGLQSLPEDRYQDVDELRQDLLELRDRLDGAGITHGALWVTGRQNVQDMIECNPSFAYIMNEEELFPSIALDGVGSALPVQDHIRKMLLPGGSHAVLTALGGMGKTTALLRSVLLLTESYRPNASAVAYVSLYDYNEENPSYICDRILEHMKFSPKIQKEAMTFSDARNALLRLLDQPLDTPEGERPVLLLLLDGLNEVTVSKESLLKELRMLAGKQGVRILIASRTEEDALDFQKLRLTSLTDEDVHRCIARYGLFEPESEKMRELLQTPLLLSIYVRSALISGQQVTVKTEEDLLECYFRVLRDKATRDLPDMEWQVDAAMTWILPVIAYEIVRRKCALRKDALAKVMERCYRLLPDRKQPGRVLRKLFPQWSGHSREIRGSAGNADEWYGHIVHNLLWKRLGLLVLAEDGSYQLPHEDLLHYQSGIGEAYARKLSSWQHRRTSYATSAALVLTVLTVILLRPPTYDDKLAEDVLSMGVYAYATLGNQAECLRNLADCALENPNKYDDALVKYRSRMSNITSWKDWSLNLLDLMLENKDTSPLDILRIQKERVVSWSQKPLNEKYYVELISLPERRAEEYAFYSDELTNVMERKPTYREEYAELLQQLAKKDADIAADLYVIVCTPHITGRMLDGTADAHNLSDLSSPNWYQNEILNQKLKALTNQESNLDSDIQILSKDKESRESIIYHPTMTKVIG